VLSLVPELKKVPDAMKLDIKTVNRTTFTLVVSSCPWKIDAQVTAGLQITLAREKFSFLKINNDVNKSSSFF
jgi:hypothetical protein